MKTWMVVVGFMMFSSFFTSTTTITRSDVKSRCPDRCGNISVPYPFGIDDSSCALNSSFLLHCNTGYSRPQLIFGKNIPVLNISVENGTMITSIQTAHSCYNESGELEDSSDRNINLGFGPFRFSDTRNKLTAFGCDTMAFISDNEANFGSGCLSLCTAALNFTEGGQDSCSGIGCCQTSIPKSLKTLNITLLSANNHTDVWKFNPCDYAFIADNMSFDISGFNLSDHPDKIQATDVAIEWVIEEKTCDDAKLNSSTYACTKHAECYESKNGKGYRCRCLPGFEGNPYLPSMQGCQNIDECKDPKKYPCEGACKDTIGNYTCTCPLGMYGDGKTGCRGYRNTTYVAITGAITLSVIMGLSIMYAWKLKRKQMNFSKNGGMVLKRLGMKLFKEAELAKVTKNYDNNNLLGEGGFGRVYKGVLSDNTSVAVKVPREDKHSQVTKAVEKIKINTEFEHEIEIVSMVKHKNVVTLLGLCVETKVPLLVYEYISNGTLYQHIHGRSSNILNTWENRLRIAAETALALAYLHSLVDPPIIHGDVKSKNILLDGNFKAKVSDFGASMLISSGPSTLPGDETMKEIRGTFGYLDPEYMSTGILTEKSDVYSFGVLLTELLTGKKPGHPVFTSDNNNIDITGYLGSLIKDNGLIEAVSFEVANEDEKEEIQEVAEIAKRCVSYSGIERPTMKQVSEELDQLGKSHDNWRVEQNPDLEETQLLLPPSSVSPPEHPTMQAFDIERNIHTV